MAITCKLHRGNWSSVRPKRTSRGTMWNNARPESHVMKVQLSPRDRNEEKVKVQPSPSLFPRPKTFLCPQMAWGVIHRSSSARKKCGLREEAPLVGSKEEIPGSIPSIPHSSDRLKKKTSDCVRVATGKATAKQTGCKQ